MASTALGTTYDLLSGRAIPLETLFKVQVQKRNGIDWLDTVDTFDLRADAKRDGASA